MKLNFGFFFTAPLNEQFVEKITMMEIYRTLPNVTNSLVRGGRRFFARKDPWINDNLLRFV